MLQHKETQRESRIFAMVCGFKAMKHSVNHVFYEEYSTPRKLSNVRHKDVNKVRAERTYAEADSRRSPKSNSGLQ